jgi:hypothetical protein
MNAKVKVVADATGAIVNVSSNNPEYGYVRFEQVRSVIDDNGFLRRKSISSLVHGTVEELTAMNFYAGQELPGSIIIQESLAPFSAKSPQRDLKIAGDTGIVCTVDGQPIYRRTMYSAASNAQDTLVKHDNVEQLRAAYAEQTKVNAINPSASEFSI